MSNRTRSSGWRRMFEVMGFGRRDTTKKLESLKRRSLHLEPLEERQLLTVLYWDPNGTSGGALGGSGTWTNGGNALWYNPTTQSDVVWNSANGDTAVFQGTAGTVTVDSAGVSAGGIEFDTSSYAVGGAAITLTTNNNSGWVDGEIRVNSATDTIGAALAGSVGLTKTGSGVLTLTGASNYSGDTAIQNGTIAIATASDRLPTTTAILVGSSSTNGVLQLGDGTTAYDQTVAELDNVGGEGSVVGGGTNVATLTLALHDGVSDGFNGSLGGSGTYQNNLKLVVTSPEPMHSGTLGLPSRGSNTYIGGTTLDSGTLSTLNAQRLGNGPVEFAGGTLYLEGTLSNDITADAMTTSYLLLPVSNLTFNGNISGAGTIHCTNAHGASAVLNLHGDNHNFTGTFDQWNYSFLGGTMTTYFTSDTAGSASATWQIDSGTLAANLSAPGTIELGALSGSAGTLSNVGSAVTFAIGGSSNNQSTEFDGVIANGSGTSTVAVTKTGTGTLTLAGNNTYTGGTTINAGILQAKKTACAPGLQQFRQRRRSERWHDSGQRRWLGGVVADRRRSNPSVQRHFRQHRRSPRH